MDKVKMARDYATVTFIQVLVFVIFEVLLTRFLGPWLMDLHDTVAAWIALVCIAAAPVAALWFLIWLGFGAYRFYQKLNPTSPERDS